MEEIWKVHPEFSRFEISNLGQIRNSKTKKILSQWLHPHGYLHHATKIGGRKGINKCFKIHRLVAECFVPNPKGLPHVNHIDADKTNNVYSNLEWCDHKSNIEHAATLGLMVSPKDYILSVRRLTEENINYILSNYKPYCREFGARALSRKFSVTHSIVLEIIKNKGYIL